MSDAKIISDIDALIIGKGPAGLQAALHIARSGLSLAVAGCDRGNLALAKHIENYYGMQGAVSGTELQRYGEAQARSLGVEIYDCQAVGFRYADDGKFIIVTSAGDFRAKTILIATGVKRVKIPVEGIGRFEGRGVSHCAVCDGFFYRGKKIGVLGYARYAFSEARELSALNERVAIFTNGEPADFGIDVNDLDKTVYDVVFDPIDKLEGADRLSGVRFKNGEVYELDGLFLAYDTAGGSDLARKLGILLTPQGDIIVDHNQATNIPGVYAAGDCTGVFRQIAVAVGQGALAAKGIIEYVRDSAQ